jgi:RimJ/RimL family protein N-acetyltransferase
VVSVLPLLVTARLTLRAWRPDDADFAYDMYSRPEVQRYLGRVPRVMADRSEAVAMIERLMALDEPVHGRWVAVRRDDAVAVGTVILKSIPASNGLPDTPSAELPPSGDTEIGWHFHPDAWGHGYATEAARAVLDHAYASSLTKVVAVTNPANLASQAVCLRIGLEARGLTSEYYNSECALFVGASGRPLEFRSTKRPK